MNSYALRGTLMQFKNIVKSIRYLKKYYKISYDLETSVKKLKVMIKMFYCLRSK